MYALSKLRSNRGGTQQEDYDHASNRKTVVGTGCVIGTGTQIYTGTILEQQVEVEDYVRIGWDTKIGPYTRIMYRAQVYVGVQIGEWCRIAGYLADNTIIEDRVAFFGSAIHDYPYRTTTYEYRPSPRVCADAIVAFGAQVIGGVRIGRRAYVGANAIVTRDVPDDTIVVGANQQFPKNKWGGKLGRFAPQSVS
jgi:acetyltransferase-like isoleucine patch superfamily enzyme